MIGPTQNLAYFPTAVLVWFWYYSYFCSLQFQAQPHSDVMFYDPDEQS
jgi:hypothetical protein